MVSLIQTGHFIRVLPSNFGSINFSLIILKEFQSSLFSPFGILSSLDLGNLPPSSICMKKKLICLNFLHSKTKHLCYCKMSWKIYWLWTYYSSFLNFAIDVINNKGRSFKLRNFAIEGFACQLPSSLRRLQATPLLQTSLIRIDAKYHQMAFRSVLVHLPEIFEE